MSYFFPAHHHHQSVLNFSFKFYICISVPEILLTLIRQQQISKVIEELSQLELGR